MTREILAEILKNNGVEESKINATIDKVMSEHGKDINALKKTNEELTTELKNSTEKSAEYEKAIKDLKGNSKDAEEYKSKVEELNKALETKNNEFASYKQNTLLENTLNNYGVKNSKAVKALLNTELIKYDNDTVLGVDEQIKKLQESDPYLFDNDNKGEKTNVNGLKPTGTPKHNETDEDASFLNDMKALMGLKK